MGTADDPGLARLRADLRIALPDTTPFGSRLEILDTVDSTNDHLQRLAVAGAPEGTVVVARAQRRGRGRRGAAFHSPAGSGLYLSALFRPGLWPLDGAERQARAGVLTLLAGVAVVEAVRAHGVQSAELKWPNDVVVPAGAGRWRKLAGVLAEGVSHEHGLAYVVVGIGINVTSTPHDVGLDGSATSVRDCGRRDADVGQVGAAVLSALASWYHVLLREGAAAITQAWRQRAPSTAGRQVSWDEHGRRVSGVVQGIDDTGALEIACGARVTRLVSGSVDWEGYGA